MWEAYGLENEELLWAGMALHGGLGGNQRGTCGAVSGGAVALGLRHAEKLSDTEKTKTAKKVIDEKARKFADKFEKTYGALACLDLIGVDFSDETARKK